MRIAIIADSLQQVRGGIEYHASVLRERLSEMNEKVFAISYGDVIGSRKKLKDADVIFFEGIRRISLLLFFLFLKETLRKTVIFTHGSFMYISINKDVRRFGYRDFMAPLKAIFDRLFFNRILSRIGGLIALSEKEKNDLLASFKVAPTKVHVLDNFVETNKVAENENENRIVTQDFMTSLEDLKPYVCTVSRLEKRKNLISAILATYLVGINYVIAGKDQGILKEITKVVSVNKVSKFKYLGEIKDEEKVELILNSSGVILPSFFEGVPFIVYESLKLGKPVLLTKFSYMRKYDGIFECNPTVDSIARGINVLLNIGPETIDKIKEIPLRSDQEIVKDLYKIIETVIPGGNNKKDAE